MAPYLRKDSKKESCFELTSQDRRSYEVGWTEEMGILISIACEPWLLCWVPAFLCYFHFLPRPSFLTCSHLCYAMPSPLLCHVLLSPLRCHSHPRFCLCLAPVSLSLPFSVWLRESLVYCSTQSNSSFIASNFMTLIPILFIFQLIIFTCFHKTQKKKNLTVKWKIIYFPTWILLSKIIFLCVDALLISGKISKILVTMITSNNSENRE